MKKYWISLILLNTSFLVYAQDAELINKHQAEKIWYLEPMIWIGSGILLLLIMLSLLFRISKKKKEPAETPDTATEVPTSTQENSIADNQIHS